MPFLGEFLNRFDDKYNIPFSPEITETIMSLQDTAVIVTVAWVPRIASPVTHKLNWPVLVQLHTQQQDARVPFDSYWSSWCSNW